MPSMSQTKKIGVGVVGCGTIAEVHAEALRQLPNAELISAYSRNRDKALRLSEKFDIAAYDDWDEFIGDRRLEVAAVCTPNGTHLDYGRRIAAAGKHVVVEKPIEITLARGRQLIADCKKHGVRLAVIFQNRFLSEAMRMKAAIESGELGRIFMAEACVKWHRTQAYYDSAPWRGTLALDGGGVLINQAIHTIDLLQWMLGKVATVFGHLGTFTHARLEGEDTAVATVRFHSGALGVIEATTSSQPAVDRRLEIRGEKGTAILNGDTLHLLLGDSSPAPAVDDSAVRAGGASSPMQNFKTAPHRQQYEAILDALNRNQPPPVSGEESLAALAIITAIYESARRGRAISLSEFET